MIYTILARLCFRLSAFFGHLFDFGRTIGLALEISDSNLQEWKAYDQYASYELKLRFLYAAYMLLYKRDFRKNTKLASKYYLLYSQSLKEIELKNIAEKYLKLNEELEKKFSFFIPMDCTSDRIEEFRLDI